MRLTVLFPEDLDDTLYSPTIGIGRACKRNIEEFLAGKRGVSKERACSLRVEHFRNHGSSLAGLIALGHDVHPDEYHSFVHGRLPYELIQPDAELRELLRSITQPKILFTNSDRQHAKRALQRLGIEEECFHRIICFETMNPHLFGDEREASKTPEVVLKPSAKAMETAVRLAGFPPHRTVRKQTTSQTKPRNQLIKLLHAKCSSINISKDEQT
ncbi:Haloacid dehalogenase-like hydrolase family protein [Musa troglodytarum]|uniref:Haloacid dehalogenase-like hydrolase family protein n=1 Tax=Musa troglodytarum TaxID=320322 RepID=A0A9E7FQ87_9LILI|nr:Haloacid dehalogenase-like hydrolase family protein [Musa troglodytarum]